MDIDRRDAFEETPEVRTFLVADLAHSPVPTTIMGITLVGVTLYMHAQTGCSLLLIATLWGGLSCFLKLMLMVAQVRVARRGRRL